MKKKEMITYSGEELMQMELPPVRFVVKDFLSQGLNILAGQAKVGKSWMMLDLCIKVAKGEKFFGFDTEKSTVLYLCLEDSPNRIRDRMVKLTDTAPANLHFAVMADNLAGDLTKQIESFIDKHPDTSLVVIDTLQKIRKAKGDMYAGDYKVISILKRLAERRGISIVCVHHTRKKSDKDPFNTVSGSTGITGAADNIYVMKTDDSCSDFAKLYMRGRDIPERVLTIQFENFRWNCLGKSSLESDGFMNDGAMLSLLSYLKREEIFEGTASDLCDTLGLKIESNVLSRKLGKYENELQKAGVEFTREKKNHTRILTLVYSRSEHGDDGDDIFLHTVNTPKSA